LWRRFLPCTRPVPHGRRVLAALANMKRKAPEDDEEPKTRKRSQPNPPGIDYRSKPQLYKVAKGEQGVLTVEPYKAEILPHWRFRLVLCVCNFT